MITDLGMPEVDGRAVAAAVKQRSPATPVILLTGWGTRMQAEEEIPGGIDVVVSKPAGPRQLQRALVEALQVTGRP